MGNGIYNPDRGNQIAESDKNGNRGQDQVLTQDRACFEKRSVELFALFGERVEAFAELPDQFREFAEMIGYVRVCALLVINDLSKGRSEMQVATKYGLSRKQVRTIKDNASRGRKRP